MDGDYGSEFNDNINNNNSNDKWKYTWGVDQYIINSIFMMFPLITEHISQNRFDTAFDFCQMTWQKIFLLLEDKVKTKNEERSKEIADFINKVNDVFEETQMLFMPITTMNPNIRMQEEKQQIAQLRHNLRLIHGFLWTGIKYAGLWLKIKASIPITESLRENFVY